LSLKSNKDLLLYQESHSAGFRVTCLGSSEQSTSCEDNEAFYMELLGSSTLWGSRSRSHRTKVDHTRVQIRQSV